MAVGPSAYLMEAFFEAVFNNDVGPFPIAAVYVKLHIGEPGDDGTSNAATETTRKATGAVTVASAGGLTTVTNDAAITWTAIAGSQDPTHVSLWDASSGGNFLGSGPLTTPGYTAGQDWTIEAGQFAVSIPIATD